jgi:hypothetical protein
MAAPGLDASRRGALHNALLRTIARDRIPHRPNRTEPRAKKRRPKNYQLLTQPRHTFHEAPHREKYKKTLSQCHSGLSPLSRGPHRQNPYDSEFANRSTKVWV